MSARYRITPLGWKAIEDTFCEYGAVAAPVLCRGECGIKPHHPHLSEYGHDEHRRVLLKLMADEGML